MVERVIGDYILVETDPEKVVNGSGQAEDASTTLTKFPLPGRVVDCPREQFDETYSDGEDPLTQD